MHEFSILCIRRGLNTPTLLGNSSRVTTFLLVTFFKTALIDTKSANMRIIYIRYTCARVICFTRNTCVKGIGIKSANTENTYIKSIYISDICVRETCIKGILVRAVCTKSTCTRGANAIEHLGIYL